MTPIPMTADNRPQDPSLRGDDLTFSAHEHGGAHPDCFPTCVKVRDAAGRWCVYVPMVVDGEEIIGYEGEVS